MFKATKSKCLELKLSQMDKRYYLHWRLSRISENNKLLKNKVQTPRYAKIIDKFSKISVPSDELKLETTALLCNCSPDLNFKILTSSKIELWENWIRDSDDGFGGREEYQNLNELYPSKFKFNNLKKKTTKN